MCLFEAFADFGGTQQAHDTLSVACFLYEKSASQALDQAWENRLQPILGHLPEKKRFFHTFEFMTHAEPYDRLNEAEWLSLRHDLIQAATTNLAFAAVCHVSVPEYETEFPAGSHSRKTMGGPLAMCGIWALDAISEHLNEKNLPGEVAYFFEAGDLGQDELEDRIKEVSASSHYSERYRYGAHSFVPKTKHHALGAADMLAWEYRTGVNEYLKDPTYQPGPFFDQLFSAPIGAIHFSRHNIRVRNLSVSLQRAEDWARQREEGKL